MKRKRAETPEAPRLVAIPASRFRDRGHMKPYVEAILANPGWAVVVPLNGRTLVDIRASLYTLLKRRGRRCHVYGSQVAGECIAWAEPMVAP